ncbi:MAG: hypothetical protein IPL03_06255 [Sterolibacteriaceae bacterium]|nr:hypothetical protein [Candidatus Methylophosphatis haderslevensis]
MAHPRILLIDATQLEAWNAHGGRLTLEGQFPASDDGQGAFGRYLAAHRASRLYLLADVVEEGFQYETAPAVSGADRQALLARRQAQYFYGTPLTTALSLGRERAGRRDERYLFAALTRPAMFEPWLALLRKSEAQVAGLWSTPLLAPALLARIAPALPRALLVSIGRGGIRQTYVEDGKLRFSRLAPQSGASPGDLAAACESESTKIHQYLVGQRILARGSLLPVLVLVNPAQRDIFRQTLRSSDELEFVPTDIAQAARAIGLHDVPTDCAAASLFAQILLRDPPPAQFATREDLSFHRLGRARVALLAVGAAVLAGCLMFAARQVLDALTIRNQTELTIEQTKSDLVRYQNLLAALPPLPASADELRSMIGRYRNLETSNATPLALYRDISRGLDAAPQIELDRIEWAQADDPDAAIDTGAQRAAPQAGARAERFAVAVVSGHLALPADADQRAQLAAVDAFAAALRQDSELRVSVLRMPVDIESQRALRSDTAVRGEAPRFSLRVARKIG